MTRINIIDVSELYDQHLIAEYREITMVPASLNRTLNSKVGLRREKISKRFTLNSGHVYFFYDKGLYLDKRYKQIVTEMKLRGFNPDSNRVFPKQIFIDNDLYNDWMPTVEDQKLIRQRIQERINSKPDWYRKTRSLNEFPINTII
jgi:deoxyribonuclease (pyrimidine dimer)